MRKFMIFGFLGIFIGVAAGQYYPLRPEPGYIPDSPNLQYQYPIDQIPVIPETEYYSFSAPDNFDEDNHNDIQRLSAIVRPRRVVFIRTPEKNIFSLTAEQLAKKDSLNIFVLRRDTNAEGLLTQLDEIRQSVGQKPKVHFVKYRTPEDIEKAKQAIYSEFESLPGPSLYHEDAKIPVHEINSMSSQYEETETSEDSSQRIVFRIIRHSPYTEAKETMDKDDEIVEEVETKFTSSASS